MSYEPYSPMHSPKDVSFDRMREILERHVPGGFKAGQSPKAKPLEADVPRGTLKWKRVDTMAMESEDGLYRVVKIVLGGKPEYELYKRTARGWEFKRLHLESFEAAKAAI